MLRTLFFVSILFLAYSCESPVGDINNDIFLEGIAIDAQAEETRIRDAYLSTWNVYKDAAWGHDVLNPISLTYSNWYKESMMMTPIDAFDGLKMMGFDQEAAEAKALIFTYLSFDHDSDVQVFEVTIRILGGLIAAFQIDGDYRFLGLAREIADKMMPAFQTPTKMPYRMVNLKTGKASGPGSNPAEIGTLMLEFGMLSKILGDDKYYDAAKAAVQSLHNYCSDLNLPGQWINVETGEWVNKTSSISGGIDSYYEYLWKAWLLFGDSDFKTMYEEHLSSIKSHLLDNYLGVTWFKQVQMETGEEESTNFGALDAFMPGLLSISGEKELAISSQEACFYMWANHKIEPESFNYKTGEINNAAYALRPENIESAFYLYRQTGEERYQRMGKFMIDAIFTHCSVNGAFAAIKDITTMEKEDKMESFFLAETLKYAYLLFADVSRLDLDKVVMNTEAHPFKKEF